jgi:hypothetical protein
MYGINFQSFKKPILYNEHISSPDSNGIAHTGAPIGPAGGCWYEVEAHALPALACSSGMRYRVDSWLNLFRKKGIVLLLKIKY